MKILYSGSIEPLCVFFNKLENLSTFQDSICLDFILFYTDGFIFLKFKYFYLSRIYICLYFIRFSTKNLLLCFHLLTNSSNTHLFFNFLFHIFFATYTWVHFKNKELNTSHSFIFWVLNHYPIIHLNIIIYFNDRYVTFIFSNIFLIPLSLFSQIKLGYWVCVFNFLEKYN